VVTTDVQGAAAQQACHQERYFKEGIMNHIHSVTTAARSIFSRRGLQAAVLAGAVAATIGTAGVASAATSHHVRPNGWAPAEQCLTWSGTVKYFPALGTASKNVNAILTGTLSNCNLDGQGQTYSGTVFGELSGTASKTSATISGNVAVTWPADADLDPTIAALSITSSKGVYSFNSPITAGAFTGNELWGSYQKTVQSGISGGTSQTILGSAPFEVMENLG
jgi:hypothetical protein